MNKRSGKVGVSWHTQAGRWHARYVIDGRRVTLGFFDTLKDAIAARVAAEIKYAYAPPLELSCPGDLTRAMLKQELRYSPEEGLFVRRIARGSEPVGAIAGCINEKGYWLIGLGGFEFRAHRLAYLYMAGWMPVEVDHKDHVRDNNRWDNLRPATRAINCQNQSRSKVNTSGVTGVEWASWARKWRAQVQKDGRMIHLGYFDKFEDAVAARKDADIKYGFHPNHGATP